MIGPCIQATVSGGISDNGEVGLSGISPHSDAFPRNILLRSVA